MGTRLAAHEHRYQFYPHGKSTVDGGKYVCDCGMPLPLPSPADLYADRERLTTAYAYMWGGLGALAASTPAVRDAMLTVIGVAADDGYLTDSEAAAFRGRLDRWREELTPAPRR